MKNYVFNIGFSKSGTTSLSKALNILNIPTLHYVTKENKIIESSVVSKNRNSKNNLLYPLDQLYQGFSDFNGEHYYQILFYQYPNSKFIFTSRPYTQWIKSLKKDSGIKYYAGIEITDKSSIMQNSKKLFKYHSDKSAEIRRFFKNNSKQFLEMKICNGDGWEKLCKFLEVPVPDVPFPHKNIT